MYDFKYKDLKEIKRNLTDYLVFVKRLMPRWVNGIPDSEIITLFNSCKKIRGKPVIIETGCGASTLAFVLYAILNKGKVFSWDTNGSKGHFLYSVINETFGKTFNVNINEYWTFVASNSVSKFTGIKIIKEKKLKGNFCFLDSDHTWKTVESEMKQFLEISDKNFIIALDDAYYKYKEHNLPYINMIRNKLKLKAVKKINNNECKPFFEETKNLLKDNNYRFSEMKTDFKKNVKKDIFFEYYSGDRKFMNKLGMEEKNKLKQRLKILKVFK